MGKKYEARKNKTSRENVKGVQSETDMKNILATLGNKTIFKEAERNLMLFKFGVVSGLRISDIVGVTKEQVKNKTKFDLYEKKTGKKRTIYLKPILADLMEYLDWLESQGIENEFLFYNNKTKPERGHINELQYYRVLEKVGKILNIDYLGTHTMRKTFGKKVYETEKDIRMVQELLNHTSAIVTARYIGISEEEQEQSVENTSFF